MVPHLRGNTRTDGDEGRMHAMRPPQLLLKHAHTMDLISGLYLVNSHLAGIRKFITAYCKAPVFKDGLRYLTVTNLSVTVTFQILATGAS